MASRFPRTRLFVALALLAALTAGTVMGIRGLSAATSATISISPSTKSQIWYKPTPVTFTITTANFSGPGQTPISGYQYGLQYDPTLLKWVSGPDVGPGTPTPQPILPCTRAMITWGTATPTPFGVDPTFTPTYTATPGAGTPTNTPTATFTPSQTPTPGGYVFVACATISNATPVASGVIGTYTFLPIAPGPASAALNLINVMVVDHSGATVVPTVMSSGATLSLIACHDLNGDGRVTIIDLSMIAGRYGAKVGDPNYVAAYDLNNNGRIDILDISLVAGAYGQVC